MTLAEARRLFAAKPTARGELFHKHHWFGVTIHTADRVLGTYPEKDAVALSPTARSLHSDLG